MNHSHQSSALHDDIWESLPWLVNGTLSAADRQRAGAHLQTCDACREEFAAQQQIHQAMAADDGALQMPAAGLQRLRTRIDALGSVAAAAVAEAATAPATLAARQVCGRRRQRAKLPTAVAAAVLLSVIASALWIQAQQRSAVDYYTVTSAAALPHGAVIRAVFATTLTLSEVQSVLAKAQLTIVAGPTEAGVYSLAMTTSESPDWSLQRLRKENAVRFAERIGPASPPPP